MASNAFDTVSSPARNRVKIPDEFWEQHREQIRVLYLENEYTLQQLLRWLNFGSKFAVTKRQLTYQLGKWRYFRKRSYLRPHPIARVIAQTEDDQESPISGLDHDSKVSSESLSSTDDCVRAEPSITFFCADEFLPSRLIHMTRTMFTDSDYDSEGGELIETAIVPSSPRYAQTEMGVEAADDRASIGVTFAPSVTSSKLTGLRSFRSLARRLETLNHLEVDYLEENLLGDDLSSRAVYHGVPMPTPSLDFSFEHSLECDRSSKTDSDIFMDCAD